MVEVHDLRSQRTESKIEEHTKVNAEGDAIEVGKRDRNRPDPAAEAKEPRRGL
jgi:hypothetical protein